MRSSATTILTTMITEKLRASFRVIPKLVREKRHIFLGARALGAGAAASNGIELIGNFLGFGDRKIGIAPAGHSTGQEYER
ncbi:hypothetical protein C7I85_16560 [Mesorhizobium soli]|uniref:Uncharacterized protein n=1 Tax=Pseudaminobacter soli (ex Li et al. 2025) TaxID=1295366 RepID=A0A2P7S9T2_9HYPH|nr:hypothetical protein C7I85_16560 [Mesorhizobium soli]